MRHRAPMERFSESWRALLMAQARAGSDSALGSVLESFRDYLLLVANDELPAELRPKLAPSDAVQQTFLEATRSFGDFSGKTGPELLAWLQQILINNIRDSTRHFRLRAKRDIGREVPLHHKGSQGEVIRHLVDSGPSPSWHAVLGEERSALRAALHQLPSHYQQVIHLRNFESRQFENIGSLLGMSADGARKLWVRALAQLARHMKSRQSQL